MDEQNLLTAVPPELCAAVPFWNGLLREGTDTRKLKAPYKTVIVALFPYFAPTGQKNAALFAGQPDYHDVIKQLFAPDIERLANTYPQDTFDMYVDSSPFKEVTLAQEAGLGIKGSNNLLINERYGSYVYIGEIATTVAPELLGARRERLRYCTECGVCQVACPGRAIGAEFDRTRCASYISQQKSELAPWQKEILVAANTIYGCDICQEVCPLNSGIDGGRAEFCEDMHTVFTTNRLTAQIKGRALQWRGEAVLRRNLFVLQQYKR